MEDYKVGCSISIFDRDSISGFDAYYMWITVAAETLVG